MHIEFSHATFVLVEKNDIEVLVPLFEYQESMGRITHESMDNQIFARHELVEDWFGPFDSKEEAESFVSESFALNKLCQEAA